MAPEPSAIVGLVQQYEPPRGAARFQLRAWREYRVLTQQDLADLAGVARRTIVALETTDRRAHPSTIRALAAAIGTTPEQLRRDPPA